MIRPPRRPYERAIDTRIELLAPPRPRRAAWIPLLTLTGIVVWSLACDGGEPTRTEAAARVEQRARNLVREGRWPEAIEAFRSALLEQDSPGLRVELARALIAHRSFDEARVELARGLELRSDAATWVELGHLLREHLRDPRGGATAYQKALELAPGNAEAHLNLGLVLLELGDPEAARAEVEAALAFCPPDAAWREQAQQALVRAHLALRAQQEHATEPR